jgi:hypothetical protein
MREADLDHAFAETLEQSATLQSWLLSGGRFAKHAGAAQLLHEEQAASRKAAHWWKHWWCTMPDGSQGETDIFAVFEAADGERFALHIENKPPHGKLLFQQAAAYRPRAAFKANDPRWLGYSDFEVLIVGTAAFLAAHEESVRQFDRAVTYEEVAALVPLFADALAESRTS